MVQKLTCPNGVRIVAEEMKGMRSVAIGIWIGTGSRQETPKNNGISHFLEHMFFKGTATRSAADIAESFDSIGGQVNAFTSKEYTCYYAKVLDTHAHQALDVLSDMFFNSLFDEEELARERNVVLEEIKMYEDAPDDMVHDLLNRASYEHHALGYPILGTEQTLMSFTGDDLRRYVHDYYRPDNVVVSVAGNITPELLAEVEVRFGTFTRGEQSGELAKPTFSGNRVLRQKETEQAHLCIGYDALAVGDPDMYNLIVLNNVLGGSMSSRLFQEVREKRGLAYSVYSYHSAFQDGGNLTIYGGTSVEQLDELYETIEATIASIVRDGLTEKEVANSREQMKGSLMLSLESTNSRMSRNGKNELVLGRHRSLDEIIELIDEVTVEKVNALAKRIFSTKPAVSLVSPLEAWAPITNH